MDTLEYRTDVTRTTGSSDVTASAPVLWRNKTARQVYEERFFDKDYSFKKEANPPKSLNTGAEYCQQYTITPNRGERNSSNTYSYSTLVELPEKK